MYLKSLTLKGFKSFAKPTTFQFEPGVTAIVGPNGSGKSNVVDALAWVMGEQGVKTLRGGKMDDVIFAGTSVLEPLGRAEVVLTIDNSDGALPIAYTEVTIRRTLFRNGSSEYAINGESCRLREVQDLLSDSGLGREMHVIVGQGRLDSVLRATSDERRGFIEEAAGILKHRRRKERTIRKLDSMDANLHRLTDLSTELRRQLTPLGKQAELARSAQHVAAEARDARARLLADDAVRLRTELAQISDGERVQQAERDRRDQALSAQTEREQTLDNLPLSEDYAAAQQVVVSLEKAQTKLLNVANQAEERIIMLRSQEFGNSSESQTSQAEVDAAVAEYREICDELPPLVALKAQRLGEVSSTQQALADAELLISEQRSAYTAFGVAEQRLRSELLAATRVLQDRNDTLQLRTDECTLAEQRAGTAEQELLAFVEFLQTSQTSMVDSAVAHDDALVQLSHAEESLVAAQLELREVDREHVSQDSRRSVLVLATESRDASDRLLNDQVPGVLGRVSDIIQVEAGYEAAVATALGTLAEAILVSDTVAADKAIGHVKLQDYGRVSLVPAAQYSETAGANIEHTGELPVGVRLCDVTVAPDPVLALLSHAFFTSRPDEIGVLRSWCTDHEPSGRWVVVAADGTVCTAFSLSGGSQAAPSRLELRAEIESATSRLAELETQVEVAQLRARDCEHAVTEAKDAVKQAFAQLRAEEAAAVQSDQRRHQLVVRAESLRAEADRAAQRVMHLRTEVSRAEQELEESSRKFESFIADPPPMPDDMPRVAASEAYENARAAELSVRVALETLRERERLAGIAVAQLEQRFAAAQRALAEAQRRAEVRGEQLRHAERVRDLVPVLLRVCDVSVAAAKIELQKVAERQREVRDELRQLREASADERRELFALGERLHDTQLLRSRVTMRLEAVIEGAAQLGLTEEVLCAEYGPEVPIWVVQPDAPVIATEPESLEQEFARELGLTPVKSDSDSDGFVGDPAPALPSTIPYVREQQEQRLVEAERALKRIGKFNPLALEEFAAAEQRHQYLAEQLEDLTRTRQDLLRIIRDLDSQMAGIFASAFADTQAAFAQVFPILFPGGSGQLNLTDSDNLLETGIEMTVRPAGKRITRMSLLSGGERSLAAVAWLIAIFTARPSPFYIMDEVEAALDDANLGRLLSAFETLREGSQLIVITHQKRTMEIADALYGITMRQDGVSTVIGQKLDRSTLQLGEPDPLNV